jgi:hypothetical protein
MGDDTANAARTSRQTVSMRDPLLTSANLVVENSAVAR